MPVFRPVPQRRTSTAAAEAMCAAGPPVRPRWEGLFREPVWPVPDNDEEGPDE